MSRLEESIKRVDSIEKSTDIELDGSEIAERNYAKALIKIRDLHVRWDGSQYARDYGVVCHYCNETWPCRTIQIIGRVEDESA